MTKPADAQPIAMISGQALKGMSEDERLAAFAEVVNAARRAEGLDEIPVDEQIARFHADKAQREASVNHDDVASSE